VTDEAKVWLTKWSFSKDIK